MCSIHYDTASDHRGGRNRDAQQYNMLGVRRLGGGGAAAGV